MGESATVDLDAGDEPKSRDRFLLNSILIFVLRKGYTGILKEVIQLYGQLCLKPPPFCVWCCATVLFSKTLNENLIETDSNNCNLSTNYQDQLETLITVGNNLFSKLNDSSPYKPYLNTYLKEARRVIMHLYLESSAPTSNYTLCFSKLNQHYSQSDLDPGASPCASLVWNQGFPTPLGGLSMSTNPIKAPDIRFSSCQFRKQYPSCKEATDEVHNFRLRFLTLFVSEDKVNCYLNERWFPARFNVFKKLQQLAFDIVKHLPEVLFDKVSNINNSSLF
ncbi:unnamed protein product [Schistosoma margrebowiei]|uniref:Uncharacterized protein n=1 Tax=Schistosoma margrebowiei TaxID=48269 RepID=A0A183MZR5_9TREM|nr:unnamed protein product [Schistosoma margrebowiei]